MFHVFGIAGCRIVRPATAMFKRKLPESAPEGAPEVALGNGGAEGSAPEGAVELARWLLCEVLLGCSSCCWISSLWERM